MEQDRPELSGQDKPLWSGHYEDERKVPPGAFVAPTPRPERPPPPRPEELAEWWRRVIAFFIDAALLAAVVVVPLLTLLGVIFSTTESSGSGVEGDSFLVEPGIGLALFTVPFLVLLVSVLYAPVLMALTNGRTLGKMAAGCRVVRADGQRMTFGFAVLREALVKGLAFGIGAAITGGIVYVVDALWPLVDKENRALHDLAVDSRVVRTR